MSITAPSSGPTEGLAIVYDRLNTRDLHLSGNGAGTIVGHHLRLLLEDALRGNGCSRTNRALIVVDRLEFNGSPACLRSDYTLNENVYVPPDQLHLSK